MARHAFVQTLDGDRVLERSWRADASDAASGWVLDAAYLSWSASGRAPWRWLAPLFGVTPTRRILPPFGDGGDDALGLLEGEPTGDVVRVVGEVTALGSSTAVLDDLWLSDPFLRVVELDDFAVIDDQGEPTLVSCGLAPLFIARPASVDFGAFRERLGARTRSLLPESLAGGAEARALSLAPGMRIEVRGVTRPLHASIRRHALEPASFAYRSRATRPLSVIGDEDGTRLVIRVL